MTERTRIKIAAAITGLFLAGISAAGLATTGDQSQTPATSAVARTAPRPAAVVRQPGVASAADRSTFDNELHGDDAYWERENDD